jgi:hypothetical protein
MVPSLSTFSRPVVIHLCSRRCLEAASYSNSQLLGQHPSLFVHLCPHRCLMAGSSANSQLPVQRPTPPRPIPTPRSLPVPATCGRLLQHHSFASSWYSSFSRKFSWSTCGCLLRRHSVANFCYFSGAASLRLESVVAHVMNQSDRSCSPNVACEGIY